MMVDDPSENYLCMPTQGLLGPGGARLEELQSAVHSLEYLHVKALRAEIFKKFFNIQQITKPL